MKKLLFFIFMGPAKLVSTILYLIVSILHLRWLFYPVLCLFSPMSLIYACFINIPYSKKEKFIKLDDFNDGKYERLVTIAMPPLMFAMGFALLAFSEISLVFAIFGFIYMLLSIIFPIYKIVDWKKTYDGVYQEGIDWRKWEQTPTRVTTEERIELRLVSATRSFVKHDTNSHMYTADYFIPYGRCAAFIAYFNRDLSEESPVYYSPSMSTKEDELREYGVLVTTRGIYISDPISGNMEIPLKGLYSISRNDQTVFFDYGWSYGEFKMLEAPVRTAFLIPAAQHITDVGRTLYHDHVVSTLEEALLPEAVPADEDEAESMVDKAGKRKKAKRKATTSVEQNTADISKRFDDAFNSYRAEAEINGGQNGSGGQGISTKAAEMGGLCVGLSQNANIYNNEVKNLMNGARGGGYAAEYGNNAVDRITGHNTQNMAQELENGHQKLHGADRNVSGVNIQTKYYMDASQSVGAAFEHKQAVYLNDDGTMMQIEVPRDQYVKAVELMRERIKTGQVPKETDPKNAEKYVRKGYFTYEQANNIRLAGSVEGIVADATQGIVCSVPGAGITAALTFASALWHGENIKEAAKISVKSSITVMGRSAGIYLATMQLSRKEIINVFAPKLLVGEAGKEVVKGFAGVANPVFTGAEKLASGIRGTSVAKSGVGKAIGLDKVEGRQLIGTGVILATVYVPDICRLAKREISLGEFGKRTVVNTGGLAGSSFGAAFGSAFGPLGTIAGSFIGGWLGRKGASGLFSNDDYSYSSSYEVKDWFTQKDAIAMLNVFKEEFLDIVMQYQFTKEEFKTIADDTISSKNLEAVLRYMKKSDNPKEKADELLNEKVRAVLSKRKLITIAEYNEGMELVRKEVA